MTRNIDASVITASQQDTIRSILMCDLDFGSAGHVLAHTGVSPIIWNGKTFLGVGEFGGISAMQESIENQASGITLTLSGVDSSNISAALGSFFQGNLGIVYLVLLDSGYQMIGDPVILFQGKIDTQTIILADTGTINVTIENRLSDWDRPRLSQYNDQYQQSIYQGDTGLAYAATTAATPIQWG